MFHLRLLKIFEKSWNSYYMIIISVFISAEDEGHANGQRLKLGHQAT